ncbi:hypothetical protein KC19_7G082200 [Ceratodon purpureus]|uniref:tRNA dimethylallyltransferase n=1 Tax=Ceratodon purpureus TaxID=3225 RepID=A0A8T0H913_CERPU|nr:hypothetical protein KC19_7G082200 [Ceratodon purpureus]KAG0566700.1 hypothetical protein KC19_7G082200 [Ceratodon purpureus]KAG0566701.1 hypothetical protein KC19_7G082200 [Ceratodon purpureus]
MSTSYAVSAGFLGAGRPLKPYFGSCTVPVGAKSRAKKSSSRLRLVTCSRDRLDGSDVAYRSRERYEVIKQLEPGFSVHEKKPSPTELWLDGVSTRLHDAESVTLPAVKPRVILIAGPTAVGKTRLSIELAKVIGGEIVNADSVQVYQGLDIGAAKATLEERQGIPHHLMDMVPPTVDYPYERFVADSRAATEDIIARGLVPIIIGGTGMYMRCFMHNTASITSHPFSGEDLTGEFDSGADWDYDFQAYFLYQHRADLFPRVDIRCEIQVPALLEETSWLLDLGVQPHSNQAADAIGYEEAIDLLLEARRNDGVVTEERFLEFLTLFQHNCRGLVKKQVAWWRKTSRSDVRRFRWIQAGQPVEQMVDALVQEYEKPAGSKFEVESGKNFVAASFKEQKRMQSYKPTLKMYSDPDAVASVLRWIKSTQGSR